MSAKEATSKEFLFMNKRNRTIQIFMGIVIVAQFAVFKYFYPYPSFIHGDSFVYIRTAYHNLGINTYLIGYSMFIRLLSVFSCSDLFLVFIQYLLSQIALQLLLFTIFYFYNPTQLLQRLLLVTMPINPLILYLANLVSSDSFFLSLSMIWLALLLWIIHRPSTLIIFLHALVLYISFTVRYNALIYPLISFICFCVSQQMSKERAAFGVSLYLMLITSFIMYTGNKYKLVTGTWQYAPFSGWQLANNAMYAYRYVDKTDRKITPIQFRVLDNMVREYFDSTRDLKRFPQESLLASTVYMWDSRLTLYKYRDMQFSGDSISSEFKRWASIAPFYKKYGLYIIKKYPVHYFKYFLWPNAKKYFATPVEFLGVYNTGKDTVPKIVQQWFQYPNGEIKSRIRDKESNLLFYFPVLTGILNLVFPFSILTFGLLKGFKKDQPFRLGAIIVTIIWITNAAFSIFSTASALRFMAFPVLLMLVFSCLFIDWIYQAIKTEEIKIKRIEQLTIHPSQ